MKVYLPRFFKHYATLLVFTLLVTNCESDPIVETTSNNDTNNALVFEALLETAKQKVKQYNAAASQTSKTAMARGTTAKAKQSFDAKYGRPVFNKTIRLTNHLRKPILIIPLTGRDNKVMNLLVGYEKEHIKTYRILTRRMGRGNVLYYNSNSADACRDTGISKTFIGGLFKNFKKVLESTSFDPSIFNDLAEGCWEWNGDASCICFASVACDSVGGSGGGGGGDAGGVAVGNPNGGSIGVGGEGGGAGGGSGGDSGDGSTGGNNPIVCGEPPFDEPCPEGYIKDKDNNCVKQPCPGNPVRIPEIAPQYGQSGIKGALHGCTRYGIGCTSPDGRTKLHNGIDLKNDYGEPIYAMYSGFIYTTKHDPDGAGYYTRIQSTVNGETFLVEYYHLQSDNRILQGNPLVQVNAGDIIGYQGDSGNLKGAIADGTVDSHVHIEVRVHDGSSQWGYSNFSPVDPRDYLNTIINADGTSEENTDCNN